MPSIGVIGGAFTPLPHSLGFSWVSDAFDIKVGDADAQRRLAAVVASIAAAYAYRRLAARGAFHRAAAPPRLP